MPSSQPEPSFVHWQSRNEEFSLLALGRVLSLRRRIVIWFTIAACTFAFLYVLLSPKKFSATAVLELNQDHPSTFESTQSSVSADHVDAAVSLATEVRVLQGDQLALQVVKHLNLEDVERQRTLFHFSDPGNASSQLDGSPGRSGRMLRKFHKNLSVQAIGGTRILEIRYLDRDPALAASIVNSLIDNYLNQHFQTRFSANRQASEWLSHQLADLKNDVETSRQRLADYQRQTGILGESETNNVIIAKLEDINRQLSAAQSNRIVKEAVWRLAKGGDPELISSMAGTSLVPGIAGNPAPLGLLPSLRAQEAQLKADIAQTSERLGPTFPKLIQMRAQLADLQASIQSELGKISARAENDYLAAKTAEDMERALFEKQKEEANRLNDSAVQYGILKREADANRDLYQGLLGKLKEAGVLSGLRSSDIVVVDPARIPDRPVSPNPLLVLPLGTVVGLVLGVAAALFRDQADRIIRSPQAIVSNTPHRLLAVLPHHGRNGDDDFRSSIRDLRSTMAAKSPRVIGVSSPTAAEGRTTVAVDLAFSLASAGRRVLLVDADLLHPSLHTRLKLKNSGVGFSELIADPQKRPDLQVLLSGLTVLTAGNFIAEALDHLDASRLTLLLEQWKKQYDDIILDTPSVLDTASASLIAKSADTALLIVRANRTSLESLERATEAIEAPCIVLNDFDFRSPAYKHYYGHRYRSPQERKS